MKKLFLNAYYALRPLIPRRAQLAVRRKMVLYRRPLAASRWPVDPNASKPPRNWHGWPEKKRFALILTHDVETLSGHQKCSDLMKAEQKLGFRSSFNFVPRRYRVSPAFRELLTENGFEVGVHGLYHDGKLYKNRGIFQTRAVEINHFLQEWGAVGFRSPAMHHHLDWLLDLSILYDSSTFDTDPFEPQSDGAGTIFPFRVKGKNDRPGFVELPYTLPQDFTLFVLMGETGIDIWKTKLDWIAQNGGMALLNTHPDYMDFTGGNPGPETYSVSYYLDFLEYVQTHYGEQYWHALPREIARFWLARETSPAYSPQI